MYINLFITQIVITMGIIFPLYVSPLLRKNKALRLFVKSSGALFAATISAYIGAANQNKASVIIAVGLGICALSDTLINISLPVGAASFLLAHLCFTGAFLTLAPFSPLSLIPFALFSLAALLFLHSFKKPILYVIYALIILFTLSVAVLLPWQIGCRGIFAATGMFLFAVSDSLIAANFSHDKPTGRDAVIMGLYYVAILMLSGVALIM